MEASYEIHRGVPVYDRQFGIVKGKGKWQQLVSRMKSGDSVVLDKTEARTLYAALKRDGFSAVTRIERDGTDRIRVWKGEAL